MLLVLNKALIHVVGHYTEAQVSVLRTQRARRRDDALERRIDESWARRTQGVSASGPKLFDSQLARLVAHGVLPDKLALFVGETTFREFVGTNLDSAELHESLGDDYFANPLGVSAAIITKDDTLLLARRSNKVAEAQGQWDLPGGHTPYVAHGGCHPFAAMMQELDEELGLRKGDIESLACIGLMENGLTHKPELIFLCRAKDRAKKLLKRLRAQDDDEHDDFLCVPSGKGELLELLRHRGHELTPVAAGGIGIIVS